MRDSMSNRVAGDGASPGDTPKVGAVGGPASEQTNTER